MRVSIPAPVSGVRNSILNDTTKHPRAAPDGADLVPLIGHTALVSCVAFSPDGSLLASVSYDGSLILWGVPARSILAKRSGYGYPDTCAFSPDGRYLFLSDPIGGCEVLDVRTLVTVAHLPDHTRLACHPMLGVLAVRNCAGKQGALVAINTEPAISPSEILQLPQDMLRPPVVCPEGRLVALPRANRLDVVRLFDAELVSSLPYAPEQPPGLTCAPDYDLWNPRRASAHPVWHDTDVFWARDADARWFVLLPGAPGETSVACGHRCAVAAEPNGLPQLMVASASSGRSVRPTPLREAPRCAALTRDEKLTAAGCHYGLIDFIETYTGHRLRHTALESLPAQRAEFDGDGCSITSFHKGGWLLRWDRATGELVRSSRCGVNSAEWVMSPTGELRVEAVQSYERGWGGPLQVHVYDAQDGRLLWSKEADSHTLALIVFSADGSLLVHGQDEGLVVREAATGQLVKSIPCDFRADMLTTAAFSPDGKLLALGELGFACHIVPVHGPARWTRLATRGDTVTALAWAADGRAIAVGTAYSPEIQLLASATGAEICVQRAHTSGICSLRFSADGALLLSASDDGSVRIWETATSTVLRTLQPLVSAESPDRPEWVCLDSDGSFRGSRAAVACLRPSGSVIRR